MGGAVPAWVRSETGVVQRGEEPFQARCRQTIMSLKSCSSPRLLIALAVTLLLAACGEPSIDASEEKPAPSASTRENAATPPADGHGQRGDLPGPPPVTVHSDDRSIALEAWTFCFETACVDGSPPENPPDVGSPGELAVEFPLEGWTFKASFRPAGKECGRVQQVKLEDLGEGRHLLRPAGYAGTYDVTLFGRGEGDLFTTFRWSTPTNGPLPAPKARLAVLADHDGATDSYGIELMLNNLATTPGRAAATITVRAANGRALTFDAKRAGGHCFPEGTIYWDGPDAAGKEAAALGPQPFTYEVSVMLDGERYEAAATWPDDEIHGNEPSVRLRFSPPLPHL